MAEKGPGAFRTIGEVAEQFGIAQHILRFWESKFPQLRPLQRAGNRRYYRPEDVALVARIQRLLDHEGYTIKGVQRLLADRTAAAAAPLAVSPAASDARVPPESPGGAGAAAAPLAAALTGTQRARLRDIRALLADGLARSAG
jgi:DNA-binding transcriptional MerR regulator